jgi:hypothetical protein
MPFTARDREKKQEDENNTDDLFSSGADGINRQ